MNKTKKSAKTHKPSSALDPRTLPDSKQQPAWHVAVLGVLTCAVPYTLYWCYKTWRDLKDEAQRQPALETDQPLAVFLKINPLLRTFGLLVPILNIYLLALLVLNVANLDPDRTSFPARKPLVACGLITGAFLLFLNLGHLPGAFYLLSLLSPIPLAFVQQWLNRYWASVESPDRAIRYAFSMGEMAAIIVGASLIGLAAAGLMMGVKPH